MTKTAAIAHYGSQEKLARVLGISQAAVAMWGEFPPDLRQLQIERVTRGKLRAEPWVLNPKLRAA
jgi:DNA-binding transcriptional regulator YdaS (Cro superfamily)